MQNHKIFQNKNKISDCSIALPLSSEKKKRPKITIFMRAGKSRSNATPIKLLSVDSYNLKTFYDYLKAMIM